MSTDLLPFDPPPRPAKHSPELLYTPSIQAELEQEITASAHADRHGPIPLRIRKPFPVNQDWAVLDVFYANLFGFKEYLDRGYLTKELAWQAITYKSHNHGMDPYNEKLAHLGPNAPPPPSFPSNISTLALLELWAGRGANFWL
jgi:hypothetical protein